MTTHRGHVELSGEVILENITFHITRQQGNLPGFTNWSGYFHIPMNQKGFADFWNGRGPFCLVLDDGQRGEFNPMGRSNFTTHIYQMNFQGIGELK